ncbi:MAG: acyltransferase [Pseudomonadota bacterium]
MDILRAFAVLTVVYSHGLKFIYDRGLAWYYSALAFDGVSIFFVLSGFLIGGILLRIVNQPMVSARDIADFWIRRWFRTLPNYYLVLCFLLLTSATASALTLREVVQFFTFTQNIASPHPAFFPEAWSLAAEEWFYLTLPVALFVLVRLFANGRAKLILSFILVALLGVTVLRAYEAGSIADVQTWDMSLRKVVIYRLDALMFGVLGACLKFYWIKGFFWKPRIMLCLGIGILLFDRTQYFSLNQLEYLKYASLTLTPLGTLLLLPYLVQMKGGSGWTFKFVTLISAISYSMYLLNLSPVLHVVLPKLLVALSVPNDWTPAWALVRYSLFWCTTIVLSILLHYLYEKPMTGLRDRISKPEAAGKATPPAVVTM